MQACACSPTICAQRKLRSVATIAAADQRPPADYSSVWSSISASGAFFLTDSIPASADCLRSYASLVAMTCPLEATRLKWYLPVEPFLTTNLPAMSTPRAQSLFCDQILTLGSQK